MTADDKQGHDKEPELKAEQLPGSDSAGDEVGSPEGAGELPAKPETGAAADVVPAMGTRELEEGGIAAAASAGAQNPESEPHPGQHLEQHHISKILDEVLEEPAESEKPRRFRHPMWLDLILAAGLLVATGGFAVGLFKIYITHSAEQAIAQGNYKAAITLLKGTPLPGLLTLATSSADTNELLSQALYQDAMEKIEKDNDIEGALKELRQISPTSNYFARAQEFITENYEPANTLLQGGTEIRTNVDPKIEQKARQHEILFPLEPQDGSP